MGIVNSVVNIGTKALGYGKRIAKVTPEFLLGDSSEIIGKAMKAQKGSIWQKGKAGFRALENYNNAQTGNFFVRGLKNLKATPGAVANGYKTASAAAKAAGKSGVLAGVKGAGKALVKKMPLIGAALTVAIEAPNIYKAFKEGGFGAGMKEVGGAAVELGTMAAGAAIGSCFGPVGTAIGGIIGGIAGMFVRGKTYSQKKAEEEAQKAQQPEPVTYTQEQKEALLYVGLTEEDIEGFQANGLPFDGVEKAVIQEIEAQGVNPKEVYKSPDTILKEKKLAEQEEFQASLYQDSYMPMPTTESNPFATNSNDYSTMTNQNRYANDIYFQALFGPNGGNPYNHYIPQNLSNPFYNPYQIA